MRSPLQTLLLTAGLLLGLSSCSTRIATFSVASTRNFDFTATGNYQVDEEKTVSNFDGQYNFLILFTFKEDHMKEAMEGAIKKAGPGCIGIADATMRRGSFYSGLVNVFWYSVEGNPIYRR